MKYFKLYIIAASLYFVACASTPSSTEDVRKPAEAGPVGVGDVGSVGSAMPPSTVSHLTHAENLVCWDYQPSTPPRKREILVAVHLDKPLEHTAKVLSEGDTTSTGSIQIFYKADGQIRPGTEQIAAKFSKDNAMYGFTLKGAFKMPGTSEFSWINVKPDLKKKLFGGTASVKYSGQMYIAEPYYQSETIACELKQ